MKIESAQKYIIIFSVLVLFFIGFLAVELILETPNRVALDLDFTTNANQISAFGSLVGGILSFLSVLFVLYNVIEVRSQIRRAEIIKKDEERDALLNKLKLFSSTLVATTDEILSQGKAINEFSVKEISNPSTMNIMYWNTNRNFSRVVDYNFEEMFKAFQEFFKDDENWSKTFLNLYNLNDFYNDALADLKSKYKSQLDFKVSEQKKVIVEINTLIQDIVNVVEIYRVHHGGYYLHQPWANLFEAYIQAHYAYLYRQERIGDITNLRYISQELLKPLIEEAMTLRISYGFDTVGSKDVIDKAAYCRQKIREIEVYCTQYAEDLAYQYRTNFSNYSESVKQYLEVKKRIDDVVAKNKV